jgi:arsenate reductase (glutaredoxin)
MGGAQIQIFGTLKCKETQKTLRFFKERRIPTHFVNLAEKPMSPGELTNIRRSISLQKLIDRDGKRYKDKGFEYIQYDIEEALLEDPLLFLTPIVRFGGKAINGFDEKKLRELEKQGTFKD